MVGESEGALLAVVFVGRDMGGEDRLMWFCATVVFRLPLEVKLGSVVGTGPILTGPWHHAPVPSGVLYGGWGSMKCALVERYVKHLVGHYPPLAGPIVALNSVVVLCVAWSCIFTHNQDGTEPLSLMVLGEV